MERIKEVHINEAVIHVLDNNLSEPLLNDYTIELNEEIYKFLHKHVERCLKDDDLKYAIFNEQKNVIKDLSQEYLQGNNNLLNISKELAKQMFLHMRSRGNISSCDLLVISISTERGPMIAIMKMDYVKNYSHNISFVDDKVGININSKLDALPTKGKIQYAAFIKSIKDNQDFNLYVLNKLNSKVSEEYGSNWFVNNYLSVEYIENERSMTKNFINTVEGWIRHSFVNDAANAELVRNKINDKLINEDKIKLRSFAEDIFPNEALARESLIVYAASNGVLENIELDKEYIQKKLSKMKLKVNKDIEVYISDEAYKDKSQFEVIQNGDGTINLVIKNVLNYVQK